LDFYTITGQDRATCSHGAEAGWRRSTMAMETSSFASRAMNRSDDNEYDEGIEIGFSGPSCS
jgi:hypothetical protein